MQTYQLQHLRGSRLKTFLAAAARIVPGDNDAPGANTLETAGVVDYALGRLDPDLRALFFKFLGAVEVMGVFFGGRTFSKNSASARDRQLRWLERSPISKFRLGFFGLKSYVCMGYYTREDIWRELHYGGPHVFDRAAPDPVLRALCNGTAEVRE